MPYTPAQQAQIDSARNWRASGFGDVELRNMGFAEAAIKASREPT